MEEIWKDIKGYEGLYQVSTLGRVKSISYGKEKILVLTPRTGSNKRKEVKVTLCKNGKRKYFLVHRLVAEAFIPNPNNVPQVNHKDENSINNIVTNLEWCTSKYNCNYGTRNERLAKANEGKIVSEETKKKLSIVNKGRHEGANNSNAKKVLCVTTGEIFNTIKEAEEYYCCNNVSACCRGVQKSAGKLDDGTRLVWRYERR